MKKFLCIIAALLICLTAASCGQLVPAVEEPSPFKTADVSPTPLPEPTPTPTPEPTPEPLKELSIGAQGDAVARLNERLYELGYLDEMSEPQSYTEATALAVKMFKLLNGMSADESADVDTLTLIFDEDAPSCAISFSKLAPTVHMSFEELVADNGVYGYPKGYPAPDTYKIIVDIAHQVTMVYERDEEGEYTVPVRFMLCSTGLNNATPVGSFRMDSYRVRFSRFVRDGRYGQYWTQIYNAFYFHTMLYGRLDAAAYLEDTFEELGQPASHGCVRLTVPDARWMWYHIAAGTQCEIRTGSADDAETAFIRSRLVLPSPPDEHLELVAGQSPYTDNWKIEDVPHDIPFVQGYQKQN